TNVRAELKELLGNRPWVVLLMVAIFSTTFIVLRSGSTLFYFKYYLHDDGTPILFGQLDRVSVFLSASMASMMLGTACVGLFAASKDKRTLAMVLSAITGVC